MWCAVWNCKNSNQKGKYDYSFFSFPSDKKIFKKWIQFCRRNDKVNWNNARICSAHFEKDDYQNNVKFELGFCSRRLLKPTAVPHLNPQDEQEPTDRSNRMIARNYKEIVRAALNEHDEHENNENHETAVKTEDTIEIVDTAYIFDTTDITDTAECNNTLPVKPSSTPPTKTPADDQQFSEFLELSANGIKQTCNTFVNDLAQQQSSQDSTSLLFESLAVSIRNANLKKEQITELQASICEFIYGKLKQLQ